jgi:MCP family monocarboxylic acid transporter-like MFS transporter 10
MVRPSTALSATHFRICLTPSPFSLYIAWPHACTYHTIILIAILYGIFSGAFISLLTVPLLSLGKPNEVGERSGLLFTIIAFGAMCGPPISGAIQKATDGWEIVGLYAGRFKEATR